MEKRRDLWRVAWIGAVVFILFLILETALIRIEGGDVVPLLSPLLDLIRRIVDTFLEIFRV